MSVSGYIKRACRDFRLVLGSEKQSQTKPIVSYCVLRAAYCDLKKQSQFVQRICD